MYQNVGKKIKTLVSIFTVLEIIGCIIGGVMLMAGEAVLLGIIIAVAGSLGVYITSLGLYAIGDIAEKSEGLTEQIKTLEDKVNSLERETSKICKKVENMGTSENNSCSSTVTTGSSFLPHPTTSFATTEKKASYSSSNSSSLQEEIAALENKLNKNQITYEQYTAEANKIRAKYKN